MDHTHRVDDYNQSMDDKTNYQSMDDNSQSMDDKTT